MSRIPPALDGLESSQIRCYHSKNELRKNTYGTALTLPCLVWSFSKTPETVTERWTALGSKDDETKPWNRPRKHH